MSRIEYMTDQDPLKNELEVLGWLKENELKILQVQAYLAKAPKVKINERIQANFGKHNHSVKR